MLPAELERRRVLPVLYPPAVLIQLFLAGEDRNGVTTAERVPARELELFRVSPCKVISDVRERLAMQRVVVAGLDLLSEDKRQGVPAQMVARAVDDVVLGDREAQGILVAGAVNATARMEGRSSLAETKYTILVTHPAK